MQCTRRTLWCFRARELKAQVADSGVVGQSDLAVISGSRVWALSHRKRKAELALDGRIMTATSA